MCHSYYTAKPLDLHPPDLIALTDNINDRTSRWG
jgi:hypothetical protein